MASDKITLSKIRGRSNRRLWVLYLSLPEQDLKTCIYAVLTFELVVGSNNEKIQSQPYFFHFSVLFVN